MIASRAGSLLELVGNHGSFAGSLAGAGPGTVHYGPYCSGCVPEKLRMSRYKEIRTTRHRRHELPVANGQIQELPELCLSDKWCRFHHFWGFNSLHEKANPPIDPPQPPLAAPIICVFTATTIAGSPRHHLHQDRSMAIHRTDSRVSSEIQLNEGFPHLSRIHPDKGSLNTGRFAGAPLDLVSYRKALRSEHKSAA